VVTPTLVNPTEGRLFQHVVSSHAIGKRNQSNRIVLAKKGDLGRMERGEGISGPRHKNEHMSGKKKMVGEKEGVVFRMCEKVDG